ncbi:AAA family ATPase, partial [Parabacteroides sp.]
STISKVINMPALYPNCNIEWEENNELQVITYNKDFCKKNYVEQMPGIFTLGEATNEALIEIAEKQKNLNIVKQQELDFKSEIEKRKQKRESLTSTFRESAWSNVFKAYEKFFPKTAVKAGTKDGFMTNLLKTYTAFIDEGTTLDDLKKSATVLFGSQPMAMQPLNEFVHDTIDKEEENAIWCTVIVGKEDVNIARLIKALGNTDWVSQGVRYISDGSDVCPFIISIITFAN